MKASEIKVGMRVQIRVSGRIQTATVNSVTKRVERSYDYRPDRTKTVVRLSYVPPGNRGSRMVERSPAACRPMPGSLEAIAAEERAAKAAAKPKRPALYDIYQEHAMVPFGGPDGVVARARAYVRAMTRYAVDTGSPDASFDCDMVQAKQRAWIKDCLARHWVNRAMYLSIQLNTDRSERDLRRQGAIAERVARQLFADPMRVAMMGRNTLASWAGYQVTGVADGHRGRS